MRIEALSLAPAGVSRLADGMKAGEADGKNFGEIFQSALGEVNKLQQNAGRANIQMAAGRINDLSEVVVATEKANIALQLTMQVRNRMVEAYQEVMRMQV